MLGVKFWIRAPALTSNDAEHRLRIANIKYLSPNPTRHFGPMQRAKTGLRFGTNKFVKSGLNLLDT